MWLRREPSPKQDHAAHLSPDARRAAYGRIARLHEASLLRAAFRLCAGRADDAQDLVQEALVRGYRAYVDGRFEEGTNARAWLMRILVNHYLNISQAKSNWVTGGSGEDVEAGAAVQGAAQPAPTPESAALAGVVDERLERALAALPDDQRACVILVYVEEFDYAETARMLGVPIGTVRSRLSRAKRQLYNALGGDRRE